MDGKSKSAVVTLFRPEHNLERKFPSLRPLVLPHSFVKEQATMSHIGWCGRHQLSNRMRSLWTVIVKVLWRHFSDPSPIWKVGSQYSSLVLPTFLCDRTSDDVPLEAMLEALVVLVEMLLCLASMVVNLVIAISIRYIRFHDTITLKVSLLCHRHIQIYCMWCYFWRTISGRASTWWETQRKFYSATSPSQICSAQFLFSWSQRSLTATQSLLTIIG